MLGLTLDAVIGGPMSVAVSPDGRRVVSGSWDRTVSVWDLDSGRRLASLAFDSSIRSVVCHPDNRHIVVGDDGGNLYCLEYREP